MTQFGDKIKLLIDESGTNTYQLSKNSGLDRTTIQRTLTGERLPGIAFVEKLCAYLRVSPSDQREIFELYNMCKVGESVYTGRKYIKDIIERIAFSHTRESNSFDTQKAMTVSGQIDEDIRMVSGQYNVNGLIRNVLEDEASNHSLPEISISVPYDYSFLYEMLHQLYLSSRYTLTIRNLVRLNKNPHALHTPNYNLKILSHVLPFAFSLGNGYQSYYYYDNYSSATDPALIMPFFIITSDRLITLSSDFKTAILYNNKAIVSTYRTYFEQALTQTRPLLTKYSNCGEMLVTFLDLYQKAGFPSHVLEPQPCFAGMYTHDLIEKKLRPDVENRDQMVHLISQLYHTWSSMSTSLLSVFSEAGLSNFIETGVIADLPTQYALPFTIEERLMLLKGLREQIRVGYQVFAVNSSKFKIPLNTSIQFHGKNALLFTTCDSEGVSSFLIDEKSICEAFYDFVESLHESDLVFNKEETLKIIDSFIEKF